MTVQKINSMKSKTNVRFGFHELIFPSRILTSVWAYFSNSLSITSLCMALSVTKHRRDSGGTYTLSSATSTMWYLGEPFLKLVGSQLARECRSDWMTLLLLKLVSFRSCRTIIRWNNLLLLVIVWQHPKCLGEKAVNTGRNIQLFSYLICLCLMWFYPCLLVISASFFLSERILNP